jgi:phage tail-like protein
MSLFSLTSKLGSMSSILDLAEAVNYRFMVNVYGGNPLDMRFQSVSGISSTVEVDEIREGGENLYMHNVPTRVSHENLVLTRGILTGCDLNKAGRDVLHSLKVKPSDIQVSPLDKDDNPTYGGWLFQNAWLVGWTIEDLSGEDNNVIINTMEFTYNRLKHIV